MAQRDGAEEQRERERPTRAEMEPDAAKERVNPAARRDVPGEPHGGASDVGPEPRARPRGYQQAELEPRDHGGITE